MASGFLPTKDAELLAWSANFNTRITATPTAFGLTAPQATAYDVKHDAYAAALTLATDPATRTKVTIQNKDDARFTLKLTARQYARIVQAYPSVTNGQRAELGLTVRNVEPTPIPRPGAAPDIDFVLTTPTSVRLRIHEEGALRRGKPEGVKGAVVLSFVGAEAPADNADWKLEGTTNKNVFDVAFPDDITPGSIVWVTAYWVNEKLESGPAADPRSTRLAGKLSAAA